MKYARERQISCDITYTCSILKRHKWTIYIYIHIHTQNRNRPTDKPMATKEKKDKLRIWNQQIHTTIYKTDKQQWPNIYHGELHLISYDKL